MYLHVENRYLDHQDKDMACMANWYQVADHHNNHPKKTNTLHAFLCDLFTNKNKAVDICAKTD